MSPASAPSPSPPPLSGGRPGTNLQLNPVPTQGPGSSGGGGTWDHSSPPTPGPTRTASLGLMEAPSRWVTGKNRPGPEVPSRPSSWLHFHGGSLRHPIPPYPSPRLCPHHRPQTPLGRPSSSTQGRMASCPPPQAHRQPELCKPLLSPSARPRSACPHACGSQMYPSRVHLSSPSLLPGPTLRS